MRAILFLICVLGLSSASLAQTNQASWANLNTLRPGQKIQIVDATSKKYSGTFLNISETAISFKETAGEQALQKQDVHSVKLIKTNHRLRNTLIVGGVGAGVGAGIGAATHTSCSSQSFCVDPGGKAIPVAIGAVAGGLGGAVLGALLPVQSTIYSVNSH